MFFQRRCSDGRELHSKVLCITETQHNECHLTRLRTAALKTTETESVGEDVEKREAACTAGGNVNWSNHYGKLYGGSSKN